MALRIGTRGSALALVQARWVAELVRASVARAQRAGDAVADAAVEVVEITTVGDRGAGVGDKSRWVSTLEAALLNGDVDIAVHSAKDVPGELPDGLELIAVPERADPLDALVGFASLAEVPAGACIGTSSLRRSAQLRSVRPDLEVVELRGNVGTRLGKLDHGQVDALILAAAGLERLGLGERIGCRLPELVPAPGQGALALEARTGDEQARRWCRVGVDDVDAGRQLRAERALARALGASCHTPMGAWAGAGTSAGLSVHAGPESPRREGQVELVGWVGLPDGSEWISDCATGPPEEVAREVAERMIAVGARELLDRAEAVVLP